MILLPRGGGRLKLTGILGVVISGELTVGVVWIGSRFLLWSAE